MDIYDEHDETHQVKRSRTREKATNHIMGEGRERVDVGLG